MLKRTEFWISFCAAILALGLVSTGTILVLQRRQAQSLPAAQQLSGLYRPSGQEDLAMLILLQEDEHNDPDFFCLLRFAPEAGQIYLTMLPPAFAVQDAGQETTLAAVCRKGGVGYLKKVIERELDLSLDRSGVLTVEGTDALLRSCGLPDWELTTRVSYRRGERQVELPVGRYALDGRTFFDVLCCTAYHGGEIERSDRAAMLGCQLTEWVTELLTGTEDSSATDLLFSALDSDITRFDLEQRSQALDYLTQLGSKVVQPLYIGGEMTDGRFEPDADFLERFARVFGG